MQTLSYGFQLPQTGDKGNNLFGALEANITQLNGHTHDGVNSAKISSFAVQSTQQIIPSTNWTAYSTNNSVGEFRQVVTMPAGYLFDTCTMSFRINGKYAYPKVLKAGDSVFYVYTNDATAQFSVVYGG